MSMNAALQPAVRQALHCISYDLKDEFGLHSSANVCMVSIAGPLAGTAVLKCMMTLLKTTLIVASYIHLLQDLLPGIHQGVCGASKRQAERPFGFSISHISRACQGSCPSGVDCHR